MRATGCPASTAATLLHAAGVGPGGGCRWSALLCCCPGATHPAAALVPSWSWSEPRGSPCRPQRPSCCAAGAAGVQAPGGCCPGAAAGWHHAGVPCVLQQRSSGATPRAAAAGCGGGRAHGGTPQRRCCLRAGVPHSPASTSPAAVAGDAAVCPGAVATLLRSAASTAPAVLGAAPAAPARVLPLLPSRLQVACRSGRASSVPGATPCDLGCRPRVTWVIRVTCRCRHASGGAPHTASHSLMCGWAAAVPTHLRQGRALRQRGCGCHRQRWCCCWTHPVDHQLGRCGLTRPPPVSWAPPAPLCHRSAQQHLGPAPP